MADYQLTATDVVIRTVDQAWIPNDPANRDWVEYEAWLADGGVPDPYVPPEPVPHSTASSPARRSGASTISMRMAAIDQSAASDETRFAGRVMMIMFKVARERSPDEDSPRQTMPSAGPMRAT